MIDRAATVEAAAASIGRGSKSFAFASQLFDRRTRERAWLLYSWCRRCDDLADGQDHGGARQLVLDPMTRLSTIRFLTDTALDGQATGDAAFDALGIGERARGRAVYTDEMVMHDALDETLVGRIPVGEAFRRRFGNPYAVIHRVDVHRSLLEGAQASGRIEFGERDLPSLHIEIDGVELRRQLRNRHVAARTHIGDDPRDVGRHIGIAVAPGIDQR